MATRDVHTWKYRLQKGFNPTAQWLHRATEKAQGKNCRVSLHQREFVSRRMAMNTQSFMYATIASDAIQSPLIPTERPTERPTELLQPISHIVLELMNLFRIICRHLCSEWPWKRSHLYTLYTIASGTIQSPLIPTERPTELLQPILHIVLELMNLFKTSCSHLCTLS